VESRIVVVVDRGDETLRAALLRLQQPQLGNVLPLPDRAARDVEVAGQVRLGVDPEDAHQVFLGHVHADI